MAIPSQIGLLSLMNAKGAKALGVKTSEAPDGYVQGILYLAPASLSGHNVCAMAGRCKRPCLNESGHGGMASTQESRVKKTRRYWAKATRQEFWDELRHDIDALVRRCRDDWGKKPVIRLNGTSDIAWENPEWGGGIYQDYPNVHKVDYTKRPDRMNDWLDGRLVGDWNSRSHGGGFFKDVEKYSLTFSLGGTRDSAIPGVLERGGNVAAAWITEDKKPTASISQFNVLGGGAIKFGREYPVISGDDHDLRFLDPHPAIVALYAKGRTGNLDVDLSPISARTPHFFLHNPAGGRTHANSGCGSSFPALRRR